MSKYGSRKTKVDGIVFDSKLESKRYQELKLLERAGEIRDLRLQPEYEPLPSFRKNGKIFRKVVYRADFSYYDARLGRCIVEDVKGYRGGGAYALFTLKKKLFEFKYQNLTINEVTKDGV